MKFCKDCRHFQPKENAEDAADAAYFARCGRPEATDGVSTEYLVTGIKVEEPHMYCSTMRINRCGPDGNLFEAKS